jgi:hypothetical protein
MSGAPHFCIHKWRSISSSASGGLHTFTPFRKQTFKHLSCLSWKWRERSSGKITERTTCEKSESTTYTPLRHAMKKLKISEQNFKRRQKNRESCCMLPVAVPECSPRSEITYSDTNLSRVDKSRFCLLFIFIQAVSQKIKHRKLCCRSQYTSTRVKAESER